MRAKLLVLTLFALSSCAKPSGEKTAIKTSDLKTHFNVTLNGSTVTCDAWVSLQSDPDVPIQLEEEAFFTCNSVIMENTSDPPGPFFFANLPYTTARFMIALIRPVDGSFTVETKSIP